MPMSDWFTPCSDSLPSGSTMIGGHFAAHSPSHVAVGGFALSWSNR
jgi:hypothetical protein